jgi:hypothetical protein
MRTRFFHFKWFLAAALVSLAAMALAQDTPIPVTRGKTSGDVLQPPGGLNWTGRLWGVASSGYYTAGQVDAMLGGAGVGLDSFRAGDGIGLDTSAGDVLVQIGGATKNMVGLSNVDNTADADKPVSTATQAALDEKLDVDSAVSGGHGIQDDGTPMPTRANINLIGFSLLDDETGDATKVELPPGQEEISFTSSDGTGVSWSGDVVTFTHALGVADVLGEFFNADGGGGYRLTLSDNPTTTAATFDMTPLGGNAAITGTWKVRLVANSVGSGGGSSAYGFGDTTLDSYAANLVAAWQFNRVTLVHDSVGDWPMLRNYAILPGAGKSGTCAALAGTSYLTRTGVNATHGATTVMLSAWVYFSSAPAVKNIILFEETSAAAYTCFSVAVNSGMHVEMFARTSPTGDLISATGTGTVTTSAWHHVLVFCDTANNLCRISLDGSVESISMNFGSAAFAPGTASSHVYIGYDTFNYCVGSLDEIYLWRNPVMDSTAFAAFAAALYNSGSGRFFTAQ